MVVINIPVDNETAKTYEKAPQADKKKMQILLSLWLREFEKPSISLDELQEYYAQVWDKQIDDDANSGRLDNLLADVDKEYNSGSSKPL